MSWYTVVLLVALAALGAGDVGAVARSDRDLSRILRPAFGVLLLALAWLGQQAGLSLIHISEPTRPY